MISDSSQRRSRQSAVRIFSQEYNDSSLIENGIGEYDPSFIVTKLGLKVNRCLVAGVIDRIERREGESGPFYRGQLRDPVGVHFFEVAPFQPELHVETEELLARFESGDRFLLALVGRARWNESEDGGVFKSIRAEGFSSIDQDTYKNWLIETSDATLRRIDAYSKSMDCELEEATLRDADIPEDLIGGLIKSKEHYSELDPEAYMVGVLKALSQATGRSDFVSDNAEDSGDDGGQEIGSGFGGVSLETVSHPTDGESPVSSGSDGLQVTTGDAREVIINLLSNNGGDLLDYDTLVGACVGAGSSREEAEDAIEDMRDQSGEIEEPRFGFFQISD